MVAWNLSATVNIVRLLFKPELCLPHLNVPSFNQIPIPVVIQSIPNDKIKAIVLDKDNCFAKDHDDKVWFEYEKQWESLKAAYPNAQLLIVSNSAGTNDDDQHKQAKILEERTGVCVLRHSTKKPGCHDEIMQYFIDNKICSKPNEVAMVGDRLFTDIFMANIMGCYGIWLSTGVEKSDSLICRIERFVYGKLVARGYEPPMP
ncbi:hypothetical protein CANARDRAFT_5699 [[Candida] arabinofermentans NRRL YB-2248]|uniref:Phosphatidylglycerophosphatase GEP4, mitochondrial n=1 Tax=[Candida] arabinofermentans NRRL YB-2248 TaxID=983967 RepID=A0A1E4T5W6_9ASCO|nr:hypothetical protein CANARDRAFT_5699 [[Candida] arabinofermentans NRRL YB-2248]